MAGPAQNQDLEHWAGNTRTLKLGPVKEADGVTNADLTGASARWALAKKATATADQVILKKSTADAAQMQVVDGGGGQWFLQVYLTEADTKDLKAADYYHEADVIDATGAIDTVTIGTFTLHQSLVGEIV